MCVANCVYDRKSIPKFHYTMFSQEVIWSAEIYYTNIVVCRLILKMGSEDMLLEK